MYDHDIWSRYLQATDNILKTHIISLEKYQVKALPKENISNTPSRRRNRNEAYRNIKHEASIEHYNETITNMS